MMAPFSTSKAVSLLLSFAVASLMCHAAAAEPIGLYNVSFSVNVEIRGLLDGNGNHLNSVPSDLSIIGRTNDQTGSGFFAFLYGPNRPPETTDSSVTGTGDVLVGGIPSGDGPLQLGINDGVILNGTASGFIGSPLAPLGTDNFFSSDISQSADIFFINNSISTTYFADILVKWSFDITAESHSSLEEFLNVDSGYVFDVARRTEGTGGTDLFFQVGFISAFPGDVERHFGSDSFPTIFAIAPGEEPILTARTFIGGAGGTPGAGSTTPEPPTLILFGLGGMLLLGYRLRHQ